MQGQQERYTKEEVESYKDDIRELKQRNAYLEQELALLKRMIFGSKSERYVAENDSQLSIFGQGQQDKAQIKEEEISYSRKKPEKEKNKAKRLQLP